MPSDKLMPSGITPPAAGLHTGKETVFNPFLAARELWDRRTGTYIQWIKRLLNGMVIQSVAVMVLAGYAWVAPGKVEYRPYVVVADRQGEVRTIGVIPQGWVAETKAPIDFMVREWMSCTRTIPDSRVAWGKQWERCKAFMTTKEQQRLVGYAKQRDELQRMGMTVEIDVHSVVPLTPEFNQASVEWTERIYNQQGALAKAPEAWKAMLEIAVFPPKEESMKTEQQFKNTLGVFITGHQWGVKVTGKSLLTQQEGGQ